MKLRLDEKKDAVKRKFPWRTVPAKMLRMLSGMYLICMLGVFPLYYHNKYYDMGPAKFSFFWTATLLFAAVSLIVLIFFILTQENPPDLKAAARKASLLDLFVLAYMVSLLISFALSDYKAAGIKGSGGWFMGLYPQLFFIAVYFLLSRFLKFKKVYLWVLGVSSFLVFLLGVLNRFNVDPLGFYSGLAERYKVLFLSTLGQATWYSSFLCTVLPIAMFFYWHGRRSWKTPLFAVYLMVGFASLGTQNSDSAFIGMGLAFFVYFWFSFRSNERFLRFLELVLMCLGSMRVVGILQMLFPKQTVPLEPLSLFLSQNPFLWAVFAAVLLLYLALFLQNRRGRMRILAASWVRNVCLGLLIAAIPLVLLLICLRTTGHLPAGLRFLNNIEYLNFDDQWGNGRGFTWKYAASMYGEYSLKNKLFGCGPDCFSAYSYEFHAELLKSKWGNSTLTNAHNEWLNCLLNLGVFGFIAYMGTFVTAAATFFSKCRKRPFLIALGACTLAYMGHNLFCYQQVICTATIFILFGIGRNLTAGEKARTVPVARKEQAADERYEDLID